MKIKVGQVYKGIRGMQKHGKTEIIEINGNAVKIKNHHSEGWVHINKLQTSISMGLLVLIIGA